MATQNDYYTQAMRRGYGSNSDPYAQGYNGYSGSASPSSTNNAMTQSLGTANGGNGGGGGSSLGSSFSDAAGSWGTVPVSTTQRSRGVQPPFDPSSPSMPPSDGGFTSMPPSSFVPSGPWAGWGHDPDPGYGIGQPSVPNYPSQGPSGPTYSAGGPVDKIGSDTPNDVTNGPTSSVVVPPPVTPPVLKHTGSIDDPAMPPPDTNIPMPPDTTGGTGIPVTPPPGGYIPPPMRPPNTEDPAIAAEWYSRFANVDPAQGGNPIFANFAGRPDLVNKLRASSVSDPSQIAGWLKTELDNEKNTPPPDKPGTTQPPPPPDAPVTPNYNPNTDYGKDLANDFYNTKPPQLDANGLPVRPPGTEDPTVAGNWYAQFANVDPSKGGDPVFAYFRNNPDLVGKLRVSGITDPTQIAAWVKQQVGQQAGGTPSSSWGNSPSMGAGQNGQPPATQATPVTPITSATTPTPPTPPAPPTQPVSTPTATAAATPPTPPGAPPTTTPPPSSTATTPPDNNAVMQNASTYLRSLLNPEFAAEQRDLSRSMNAQAAVTGDLNSGGYGEVSGREQGNLISKQGSRITDYLTQATEADKNRQLQQQLATMQNTTANKQIDTNLAIAQLNDSTTRLGIKTNDDLQRYLNSKNNELQKYGIDAQSVWERYRSDAAQAGANASSGAAYNAAILNAATSKEIAAMNNATQQKSNQQQFDLGVLGINATNYRADQANLISYLQSLLGSAPSQVSPPPSGFVPFGP